MKANLCLVKMKGREKADCSVLAAQMALALSYEEAYQHLSSAGRKPRRRVPGSIFLKLGMQARWDLSQMRVSSAMEFMQTGRFVVFVKGHFFAVVDGRMFDSRFDCWNKNVKVVFEVPLDNPEVLSRYPFLEKIVALDKLPDMRALNCH